MCHRCTIKDICLLYHDPLQVFVHRNVGALVPGNDLNALSVLEYAVAHLGVTDIIVAGHYDCGAIRAASSNQDLGMSVCMSAFIYVFSTSSLYIPCSHHRDA